MDAIDLQGLAAVAGVLDTDLERIAAAAEKRAYPAGAVIVARGDRSSEFFLIVEGTVEIEREDVVAAERSAGEFFGEVGAMGTAPGYHTARTGDVTAKTDVVAAVIEGWKFSELVATIPRFRHTVYAQLDRYAEADGR